jgi:hypothetical protein
MFIIYPEFCPEFISRLIQVLIIRCHPELFPGFIPGSIQDLVISHPELDSGSKFIRDSGSSPE